MPPQGKAKVVYVYAEQDSDLINELDRHLITLKRQGLIESWHPGMLKGGDHVDGEIEKHLDEADIILLLLSVDFLNSVQAYEVQMKRAMERQQAGSTRVIPILLRTADYQGEPFGKLKALPQDSRPISGRSDSERDGIWAEISRSIKEVINKDPIERIPEVMPLSETKAQIRPPSQYSRASPWIALTLVFGFGWPIYQWYGARNGATVQKSEEIATAQKAKKRYQLDVRAVEPVPLDVQAVEPSHCNVVIGGCNAAIGGDGEIHVSGNNHDEVLKVAKELLKQREDLKHYQAPEPIPRVKETTRSEITNTPYSSLPSYTRRKIADNPQREPTDAEVESALMGCYDRTQEAMIVLYLADRYRNSGNREKALFAYRNFLRLDPQTRMRHIVENQIKALENAQTTQPR